MLPVLLLGYLLLLLVGCDPATAADRPGDDDTAFVYAATDHIFPYALDEPDLRVELPGRLDEISGLDFAPDGKRLVAVNDEDGEVYTVDPLTGDADKGNKFWKDDDYEGVETVGQDVWVVKSTGTLYQITNWGEDDLEVEKYNDFLDGDNDVEGLAYDRANNRLLLGCKGQAGEGKEFILQKAIYAFDLATKELIEEPAYRIEMSQIQDYLQMHPAKREVEKLVEFFGPGQSEFTFSPSALALHPQTGELYILSSVGKLLLVLAPDGAVLHLIKLRKKRFPQPEGMCFDRRGSLYISSEAKGNDGLLMRFDQRR